MINVPCIFSHQLVLEFRPKEERIIIHVLSQQSFCTYRGPVRSFAQAGRTPLISLSSRKGIDRSLSEERYFSLACLSSALNPFFPLAFDESAKSAYRTDRNYRDRSADGARSSVEATSAESWVHVARCTAPRCNAGAAWSCVRVLQRFGPQPSFSSCASTRREREREEESSNCR